MKDCRIFRRLFVDDLFDELDDEQKRLLDGHLARCRDCSSEIAGLRHTLRAMSCRKQAEPGDDFWDSYWGNLSGRMSQGRVPLVDTRRGWWRNITFPSFQTVRPAFRWAAVFAALIAGMIIGRFVITSDGPQEPTVAMRSAQPEEQSYRQAVDDRAERYLEKSKVLLLGFVNSNGDLRPGTLDVDRERDISRGLVQEASYLKENLTGRSQQKLRRLVEELETILIEIANLEEEEDLPDVEMIRDGVGRSGILMKINVHQMKDGVEEERPVSVKQKDQTLI